MPFDQDPPKPPRALHPLQTHLTRLLFGAAVFASAAANVMSCSSTRNNSVSHTAARASGGASTGNVMTTTGGTSSQASGGTANPGVSNPMVGGSFNTATGGSPNLATGGASNVATGGMQANASGGNNTALGGTANTATGGTQNTATGGAPSSGISTDPNLKVAFIGDTATGSDFTSVLTLIKNESAAALVVEGDMSYSEDPGAWWTAVEATLGNTFPVFIARGNHDDSTWTGYLPKAANHLGGATRVAGAHDANYKTTFRGLVIATIKLGDTAAEITPFLENDPHTWKICSWHQNQKAMQIGGKTDEMGWEVYETCRALGAIIETGHEHSYERTKTLTSMQQQTVDPTCSSPTSLCVGPGRTFANVVGLGGNGVRDQLLCLPSTPPYGCKGEWAFIYTNQQNAKVGAQFITFNAGAPNVATAYFKNIDGATVDTFSITHD